MDFYFVISENKVKIGVGQKITLGLMWKNPKKNLKKPQQRKKKKQLLLMKISSLTLVQVKMRSEARKPRILLGPLGKMTPGNPWTKRTSLHQIVAFYYTLQKTKKNNLKQKKIMFLQQKTILINILQFVISIRDKIMWHNFIFWVHIMSLSDYTYLKFLNNLIF